jgi:hypothetical protein
MLEFLDLYPEISKCLWYNILHITRICSKFSDNNIIEWINYWYQKLSKQLSIVLISQRLSCYFMLCFRENCFCMHFLCCVPDIYFAFVFTMDIQSNLP